jgi:hypothetical protein
MRTLDFVVFWFLFDWPLTVLAIETIDLGIFYEQNRQAYRDWSIQNSLYQDFYFRDLEIFVTTQHEVCLFFILFSRQLFSMLTWQRKVIKVYNSANFISPSENRLILFCLTWFRKKLLLFFYLSEKKSPDQLLIFDENLLIAKTWIWQPWSQAKTSRTFRNDGIICWLDTLIFDMLFRRNVVWELILFRSWKTDHNLLFVLSVWKLGFRIWKDDDSSFIFSR